MIIQAELRRKQSEYEGEPCAVDIIMFIYISDLQFLCQEKNRSRSKNGKQYTET